MEGGLVTPFKEVTWKLITSVYFPLARVSHMVSPSCQGGWEISLREIPPSFLSELQSYVSCQNLKKEGSQEAGSSFCSRGDFYLIGLL